jgi:hypothetical protein
MVAEMLKVQTDAGMLHIKLASIEEDEEGHIIMDATLLRFKKPGKVFFRYDYTEHCDSSEVDAIIFDEEKSQQSAFAAVNTDAVKALIADAIHDEMGEDFENFAPESDGEEESEQPSPPSKKAKSSTALTLAKTPTSSGKKPKGKKKGKKAERTPAKDLQYKIQSITATIRGMKGRLEAAENKQENHQQLYDLSVKNLKSRIPKEKDINIQEHLTTCQYTTQLVKDENWVNAADFDYKQDGITYSTDPLHELAQLLRATAALIDSKNPSVEAIQVEYRQKLQLLAEYRRQQTDEMVKAQCDEAGVSPADLGIKLWNE